MRYTLLIALCAALVTLGACAPQDTEPAADLILEGSVWTGDSEQPEAEAVAVRNGEILEVGTLGDVGVHRRAGTEVIEVDDGLVVPGFIDNHTHFNRAGDLLLGINLLPVNSEEELIEEVQAARDRLPEGAWITGGDWGAYAQWEDEDEDVELLEPHRDMIDEHTSDTPVFLSRFDGEQYLANTQALSAAELSCDVAGVDCVNGTMTGRLAPEAAERVRDVVPEKPMEQRIAEADTALARLRSHGVTTIHDITPPEQMKAFHRLKQDEALTTRVYARPTLDRWEALAEVGIEHGYGSDWLEIGGLKGFVDGILGASTARFYEPYEHIDDRGIWRDMMDHPDGMEGLIKGATEAGHWPQIHAIGDQAIDTLLTMYENARAEVDASDQRWRVIHTQHLRGPEVADRMAEMDLIAEVQPFHAIDDMRWTEERVGEERARWTYAFNTLDEAGVMLSFGSDWPGTSASWYTADPLQGMYAAVTRQTLDGEPEGGWVPEERIDIETALEAYTVNNAYAAGHEESRGQIAEGLLADLVVLSDDITDVSPEDLLEVDVEYTIVDGEVVYEKGNS